MEYKIFIQSGKSMPSKGEKLVKDVVERRLYNTNACLSYLD